MLIRLLNKMLHAQNSPGQAHGSCGDSRLGCPAMAKPSGLGTLLRAVQTLFRGCRNSIITEGTYPQATAHFSRRATQECPVFSRFAKGRYSWSYPCAFPSTWMTS